MYMHMYVHIYCMMYLYYNVYMYCILYIGHYTHTNSSIYSTHCLLCCISAVLSICQYTKINND